MRMIRQITGVVWGWVSARRRARSQRLALAELLALSPARLDELGIDMLTVREGLRHRVQELETRGPVLSARYQAVACLKGNQTEGHNHA